MTDINKRYEAKLRALIEKARRQILILYGSAIEEISITASTIKTPGGRPFSLRNHPRLNQKVNQVIEGLRPKIQSVIVNGITGAWELSNEKNKLIIDRRLLNSKLPKNKRVSFYDPNIEALQEFIERKEKGMNLSDRVWNLTDTFKKELEQSIGFTVHDGKSAKETATEIKKYLNEPDRLFRRVRSEDGRMVLSKAAREYHPGQGVYRSSYKNALRLSGTETNMAFRTADHERWESLPFVTGIEVRLSNNHPRYDICDELKGKYPKDFLFRGWHPQCRCHAVPVMASDKEFEQMEDQILAGEEIDVTPKNTVTAPPKRFNTWIANNKERVSRWKSKPYWMIDNKDYVKSGT